MHTGPVANFHRMRSSLRRTSASLLMVMLASGCSPSDTPPEATPDSARATTAAAAAPGTASEPEIIAWYDRTRTLDLTGDRQPDTVRLVASGTRPDSLEITLSMLVGGEEKHRERWGSSYELALVDSAVRQSSEVKGILRAKLDSVLASVAVQPLGTPMKEDSAALAALDPRPTQRVSFAYGYETTTRLVWDAPRERFVRLWSCC